jgi:hypothetical protein
MQCLYCSSALDGSSEHVILNAIGGRKESKRLICSSCNQLFGNSIDRDFLKAIDFITLIVEPPTRRRSNGSAIRVLNERGVEYDLVAGGKVKVRYKKVAENSWIADASDADRLRANVEKAAQAVEQRTGSAATINMGEGQEFPGKLQFTIRLDNITAVRQAMKWVINLLGMEVFTSDKTGGRQGLVDERAFVHAASGAPLGGYLVNTLVPSLYGGLDHYVLAAQSEDGTVYWEASAFGGAVAMAGRTSKVKTDIGTILYRVDPVTGEQSTTRPDDITALSDFFSWVPTFDANCERRTGIAVARVTQLMNNKVAIDAMIRECMEQHLPRSGVMLQEHINAMSRCMAEKFVAYKQQLDQMAK